MVDHRHKESWWPCQEFTPKARKCRQRWMWWCCCQKILLLTRKELTLSFSKRAWVRIISNAYCHISLPQHSKGNHYREGLKSHLPVNYACKFTIFLWWWQAGVIKRGEKLGRPLQQILFGSWYHNHDDEGQVVIISWAEYLHWCSLHKFQLKQKLCHLLPQNCNMQKGSSCWEIPQDKWVSQLNMVFPQYTVQKGGPFWKIPKLIWYGCHFGGRIEYSWPSSLSCSSCCFGWN